MSMIMAMETRSDEMAALSPVHGLWRPPHAAPDRRRPRDWFARIDTAARSDVGLRRRRNEDDCAILLEKPQSGHASGIDDDYRPVWSRGVSLIVADGLGGHDDGDKASAEAVRFMYNYAARILPWMAGPSQLDHARLGDELRGTMRRLHERIVDKALETGASLAMGTTLTFCYVAGGVAHIAHAGDSRCYLLREGRLEQITTDHTMANKLIARGLVTPDKVAPYLESTLCNCLGGGVQEMFAEIHHVPVATGDTLLLCTDGLTKHVSDCDIAEILCAGQSAARTTRRLIQAALTGGGSDNVTVALCRFAECASTPRLHPTRSAVGR